MKLRPLWSGLFVVVAAFVAPSGRLSASAAAGAVELPTEKSFAVFEETAGKAFTGAASSWFSTADKSEMFVGLVQRGDKARQVRAVLVFDVSEATGSVFSLRLRAAEVPALAAGSLAVYGVADEMAGTSAFAAPEWKRIGRSDVGQLRKGDDLELDVTELVKEARATGRRQLSVQLRIEPDPVPDGTTRRVGFSSTAGEHPPVLVAR